MLAEVLRAPCSGLPICYNKRVRVLVLQQLRLDELQVAGVDEQRVAHGAVAHLARGAQVGDCHDLSVSTPQVCEDGRLMPTPGSLTAQHSSHHIAQKAQPDGRTS